jgi:hypothetical protein
LEIDVKFCGDWNLRLDLIDCATETRVIKAMRGRIALQLRKLSRVQRHVRNLRKMPVPFRASFWSARASSRRFR